MSSCEYCKTTFQSKYSLKTHLTTNKACLKIRGVEMNNQWQCKACLIIFPFNSQLLAHHEICKDFIKKEYYERIDKLINENRILEDQLNQQKICYEEQLNKQKFYHEEMLNEQKIYYKDRLNEQKIYYETHISLKDEKYESLLERLILHDKSINKDDFIEKKEYKQPTYTDKFDIKEYKFGDSNVSIRSDGVINATELCKAGGKKFNDYIRLKTTQEYIKVIENTSGISLFELINVDIEKNNDDTWVHSKVGYHLAKWISPDFNLQITTILDEIKISYQKQLTTLTQKYQQLLVKHNSSLKKHHYIKFKETDPCFYIIESGLSCSGPRYKFGIAGTDQINNIDDRLMNHRTLWPELKVKCIVFIKDVVMIEKSFKMMYEKEISINGHEIIEGVALEDMIERLNKLFEMLCVKGYHYMSDDKLKEYNDYVDTTIKSK